MARLKAHKGGCTVRAYRHGLGDCFLLAFANQGRHQRYVLIDCGVLLGTDDAEAIMTKVAKDIGAATDNHLHALVLTHQHWDHISGFGQAAAEFGKIEDDWLDGMSDLAIKLDNHLNNTSLVLAVELADRRVLLFPGDAQVESWRSWHTLKWDKRSDVTAEDLLKRTLFYKVGHHGSHNATLGEKGLEMMTATDLRAVIPLNRRMAEKQRWAMPYDKLYARLRSKTKDRTYITDEDDQPPFVTRKTDLYADFEFSPPPTT